MAPTIFWYDFETTGIDAGRDRAVQFAGVRTDLDLNIIGEPIDVFCKPSNDVVPDPSAFLVTHISMNMLQERGVTEAEFSQIIHREFSQPDTCVAGFNSIRFDDEFTRYLFYRNFYDPYAREWQGGNSRWDIIDLFRMAYALRPEGIVWPKNEAGTVTFRLEKLTAANDIGHESAHDAVSDVLATINMAKKLRSAQDKLYQYLFKLRKKGEVVRQLYPLGKQAVVHVSSMYPARQHCVSVVLPICVHPTNSNGIICFDLTKDPADLINLTAVEINTRLFTSQSDVGMNFDRIPLKTIHINRSPAIAPLSTIKGQETRLGLNLTQCLNHQQSIQRASGIVEKIQEAFSMNQFAETHDPDLMLYQGGFFSTADRAVMNDIIQAEPSQLPAFDNLFQDPRLSEMLFRYRARNYPETLSEVDLDNWNRYRRKKFETYGGPEKQIKRLADLRAAGEYHPCLDELGAYLEAIKL